jgi:hypothetical protein
MLDRSFSKAVSPKTSDILGVFTVVDCGILLRSCRWSLSELLGQLLAKVLARQPAAAAPV